jgi:hypothetical protein
MSDRGSAGATHRARVIQHEYRLKYPLTERLILVQGAINKLGRKMPHYDARFKSEADVSP